MTELSFAKSFLTTLDSRPTKLSADHIEDPKSYPPRGPYILPKTNKVLAKKTNFSPGAEPSLSVTLKSLRNPPLDVTLSSLPLSTSIITIKESLSSQTSIPVSKLKLLYSKKPVPDSKVLKDLVGEEEFVGKGNGKVEFGVMVIGGAAAVKKETVEEREPVIVGHGAEVLRGEEFWTDLKGYLVQRLKDESEGERVYGVFRQAIEAERR